MSATNLLVGTRKGLFHFIKCRNGSGTSWQLKAQHFSGVPVPFALHDMRTDTIWAANDHGHWGQKLHRSKDLGASWEEVAAPKYPEGALLNAEGKAATLDLIWYIIPSTSDHPHRFYLGTNPGGLFITEDDGDTFSIIQSLWNHPSRIEHWFGGGRDTAGISSAFVDPRDAQKITVGVSCGGVFYTDDGGKSWVGRNKGLKADFLPQPDAEFGHDPHYMTYCADNPDVLWQQNHCGIFRSSDAGQTWVDVSELGGPACFGWAIAADPKDPNVAYVVPAMSDEKREAVAGALRVCRTTDAGKTWQALTRGLPDAHCHDIVYRHGLDLFGQAELAFGSTTGNLFYSESAGDSWNCLGNYWPPVYSVRMS